ncbi:MAG: hypothetical protein IJC11_02630, partial [Alphaproteobacteria bacterium]|nr:hypothetical protein [Alphaproteobacteria bacterium]
VCDTDYYGPSCVYCAGANSKWDSTNNKCTCTLANSTWNTTQNKCICNTNYYGPSCTYCAGNYTKWDSTNNKCTCTQTSREWNASKKACVCKTGYYGDNCTYCAGDYTKWDTTTNSCTCTLANSSWDAINKKCVCINGTTWSESKKSCVTPGSTEDTCYAPRLWINGICTCPTTTPYYKSSTNECLKCYQVNESKPYWNGTKCIACYEKSTSTPVWSTTENQCVPCETLDKTKPYWNGSICTICPSDKPYWDTNKKECVACATFNVDTPVWDSTNKKCISCYASNNAKPYWNGTKCIACYEKSTSTPVWSTSKNQCVACVTLDSTKPYWRSSEKVCGCPDTSVWDSSWNGCIFTVSVENKSGSSDASTPRYVVATITDKEAPYIAHFTGTVDDYFWYIEKSIFNPTINNNKCTENCGVQEKKEAGTTANWGTHMNTPIGFLYPNDTIYAAYQSTGGTLTLKNTVLTFLYKDGLEVGKCPAGYYCPSGTYFIPRLCTYENTPNSSVTQNECHVCNVRYWRNNDGDCLYCENTDNESKIMQSECNRCSNRFWKSDGEYCYHCSNTSTQEKITETECERCTDRHWVETDTTEHVGDCYLCPTGMTRDTNTGICKCSTNYIYNRGTKTCVSCTETTSGILSTEKATEASCPQTRYYANDAKAYSCSVTTQNPETTKNNCLFCGTNVRFWKSKNNYCYHCLDTDEVADTTKAECEVCTNRYWVDGKCYPCPSGMTRDTNTGICKCNTNYIYDRDLKTCVACSTTDHFASTELSTEKSCPAKRFYADNADSYVCTDATNHPVTTQANCLFCGSKNVRYWRSNDGDCFSCNFVGDGYTSNTTQAECHTCANRYWKSNKTCFHCSRSDATSDITQSECNRCTHRFWKSNGYCYNCDRTDSASDITQAECIRCSNRYWTVTDATKGLGTCTKCASGKTPNADKTACE